MGLRSFAFLLASSLLLAITSGQEDFYDSSEQEEPKSAINARSVAPRIKISPSISKQIEEGERAYFRCRIIGGEPSPVIEWRRADGRPFPANVRYNGVGILRIANAKAQDAGAYICKATNSAGAAEATATLIIQVPRLVISPQGPKITLTAGEPLNIQCKVLDSKSSAYVYWNYPERAGSLIESGPRSTGFEDLIQPTPPETLAIGMASFEIAAVSPSDAGIYTCVASAQAWTIGRLEAGIEVIVETPPPPPPPSTARHCVRIDQVFVVDSSNSILNEDFKKTLELLVIWVDFIAQANIPFSNQDARMAVVLFGEDASQKLTLDESARFGKNYEGLKSTIRNIERIPGTKTNTALGLREAKNMFDQQPRLPSDKAAKRYTVVVTDGVCNHPSCSNLVQNAAKLRESSSDYVWGVGIGNKATPELEDITADRTRSFNIESYDKIGEVKKFFQEKVARDLNDCQNDVPGSPEQPCGTMPMQCSEDGSDCVQLECMLDGEGVPTMQVFVPESFTTFKTEIGSCKNVNYQASQRSGFKQTLLRAGDCGTHFNVAVDNLEYTNSLNLLQLSDDDSVVRDESEWRLQCNYPRQQMQSTLYETFRKVHNTTKSGLIDMNLEIYDCAYRELMPSPAIFKLKDRVCVQASMSTHDRLKLFPLKCWATVAQQSDSFPSKLLINNGCDVETSLRREQETTPVHSRFSFDAFRFKKGTCKVYVHCDLLICAANDPSSRCSQGCLPGVPRAKRSVNEGMYLSTKRVTIGPVVIGDTQLETSDRNVDGTNNRANRLEDVGTKLARMMQNLRESRQG